MTTIWANILFIYYDICTKTAEKDMRTLRFLLSIQWRIQTFRWGGGGVHPDPEIRGGADSKLFSAIRASFWSKNKGVGAGPLWAPPLDPQLVLVTNLPPPRSSTKILDIALARELRTKIKKKPYRFSLR